jgi:hypothetical protein
VWSEAVNACNLSQSVNGSRLEEIFVDALDDDGAVFADADIVAEHQPRELAAIDKDDRLLNALNVGLAGA